MTSLDYQGMYWVVPWLCCFGLGLKRVSGTWVGGEGAVMCVRMPCSDELCPVKGLFG